MDSIANNDLPRREILTVGAPAPEWLTLLGRSEAGGRDYAADIEGDLPAGLTGSLYRNGPGLFERGGVRKPHLLDGDGLIQRLSFADGAARYQNDFVRTERFTQEQAAGRYLHNSWSLRKPGGLFANIGRPHTASQAGVTIYPFGNGLYAFDEVSPAYAIDSESLATLGTHPLGDPNQPSMLKAHTKIDPVTGEWLLIGVTHSRNMKLHMIVHAADGSLTSHRVIDSPRQVYIHDFFATEHYFVIALQPLYVNMFGLLAGTSTYIESMDWKADESTLVMVVPRGGGEARTFEAPASFMWHALNAYEAGNEIVADFVGYDAPDHFIGHDALLARLMDGKLGRADANGTLRRYRMNLADGTLREEILSTETHEFPMIDPSRATLPHRIGYMTAGGLNAINTGIKRVDYQNGDAQSFDFGVKSAVGEPVFAAKPHGATDDGWLICQVLDGETHRSFFAVFDAQTVSAGPVAKVHLSHALPISFHGWWKAA